MKFARYFAHGETAYGVVEGDTVKQITGTPFGPYKVTDHKHTLLQVKLLAPCEPKKVIAIALNYGDHLGDRKPPERVEPFWKGLNCIMGPDDAIILPKDVGKVDEEGELVAVIGKRCKNVTPERALDYVLGYTCGNDVSARVWQRGDIQWWRGKGADTFGPFGPFIVTGLDPSKLTLSIRINGKEQRSISTGKLLFSVPQCISAISQSVTLEPGDILFTGTPGRPSELHAGDVVEVEVSDIGVLRNPVKAA